ncbi:MAG TPA: arylsulfatase [Gammaproteobacteria bacterium]|nr:arylsulfatase [Gammaproteobacteria bacterium]
MARTDHVMAPGARLGCMALSLLLGAGLSACGGGDSTAAGQVGEAAADAAAPGITPDEAVPAARRPNLVLIVADDLGWSEIGAFGGEIPTPNLDALAADGMLLTDFYANQSCSPTRAMLMSGTDSHLAGLGTMAAPREGPAAGAPGYEAYLNFRVASMADLLKDAGYHTYMAGKWHLGRTIETSPWARGFERSFVSIDGAAHLGALSWGGPGLAPYREDDGDIINVGDDFYSTRVYTERMVEFVESNRGDGQPFFAWLAYTAPHWPLQAPPESIARFEGEYDEGYDVIHARRIARAKELGFISEDFVAEGPYEEGLYADEPRWDEMTDEERRVSARSMEIYAAMVSDLDTYVGEFVDYLESIGERDNTFILFMSDNGPEDWKPSRFQNWIDQCCDTSYENMGAGDSYVLYGPNWAWAGSALFRRYKFTSYEGGIRVPAFANLPGRVPAGTRSDVVGSVMDVLPTFLELAGSEHPGTSYRGEPIHPLRGRSLLPELTGTGEVDDDEYFIGWELNGNRAIRQGDWKIVWDANVPDGERGWALYNLAEDSAEQFDLSAAEPERFAAMQGLWDQYERDNGVILTQGLNSTDEEATDNE